MTFANVTTTYSPNTLKLYVTISNWPFRALANSLLLTLDSAASEKATCINDNTKPGNENLRWMMVVVDDVSLYPSKKGGNEEKRGGEGKGATLDF